MTEKNDIKELIEKKKTALKKKSGQKFVRNLVILLILILGYGLFSYFSGNDLFAIFITYPIAPVLVLLYLLGAMTYFYQPEDEYSKKIIGKLRKISAVGAVLLLFIVSWFVQINLFDWPLYAVVTFFIGLNFLVWLVLFCYYRYMLKEIGG